MSTTETSRMQNEVRALAAERGAVILAHRQQSTGTVYLSLRGLHVKLLAGVVLGVLAVTVFLTRRSSSAVSTSWPKPPRFCLRKRPY